MRLFMFLVFLATPLAAQQRTPPRPMHTYSIVAMDSVTGE